MKWWCILFTFYLISCTSYKKISLPAREESALTGSEFYQFILNQDWRSRDSIAVKEILNGNVPAFLKKFTPVSIQTTNKEGQTIKATIFVSPDYVSIGHDNDWARIPLTPMAAQRIADQLGCFLPTRKLVDDIYKGAAIKLEPIPMFAFRDSVPTMYQHHLIIEGQRKSQSGLIAGIKKDIVISGKIKRDARRDRVAIYGWHQRNGQPIQPLYTGHVSWYVDYSHGVRLIYRKIKVGKKWIDYLDVLNNDALNRLLCDEEYCDFYKYPY